MMKHILEESGYTVICAVDGEDAVKQFIDHKDAVDCLLFDVIMPKKNGKTAYDEIQNIRPGIKALFVSGYTPELIHTKGIFQNGYDFIPKPVTPGVLLIRLRDALDRTCNER